MSSSHGRLKFLLAAVAVMPAVYGQGLQPSTNFSELFNVTTFPAAQPQNMSRILNEAFDLAGDDLDDLMVHRCIQAQVYRDLFNNAQAPGFVEPTMAFDGVYFVGQSGVSAWAIATGAGVVVIDALNNPEEAERILLPGLRKFGFEGHDIAALIITHEHFDHFGGARYLQDTYNVPTYASGPAWAGMAQYESRGGPVRDRDIHDLQDLTIGNLTLRFIASPGHTPGCYSVFFNVTDHGRPYTAALYGGGGIARNATDKEAQIESYLRAADLARDNNVTVLMGNHQAQDRSLRHFDELAAREVDWTTGRDWENPFVVGNEVMLGI